jgi:molybdate transport system substrate-binding protein
MSRMARRTILAGILLLAAPAAAAQRRAPLVLAAASLQESLGAAADAWARTGHPRPVISFAASSALARQVQAGATADLFVSADQDWMDVLQRGGLIVPATRVTLVGNRLVVVAAKDNPVRVPLAARPLARVLAAGPLAMADTGAVPAGRYGKAALEKLGAWPLVKPRVVEAESVRAALALVERGAAPLGIVYATDVRAAPGLRVAGVFPAGTHPPITYPIARLKASTNPEGEAFRRYLTSAPARAIFRRYGFLTP